MKMYTEENNYTMGEFSGPSPKILMEESLDVLTSREKGVREAAAKALENMKEYSRENKCAEILQDLLEKVIVNQPEDPVSFLIEQIEIKLKS